ncbi:B3 domain-containing protein REM10 [Lactuca sativa]|uniref:B3 domain-containing protein REM10 n=1 Tax=Lactuca sativa TaxID=4236 RepID=UPI0022AFB716|nr:B3 domain-containing protein REM10 [Lactuca sativa]
MADPQPQNFFKFVPPGFLFNLGNMVFDFMVFDQSTCQKHYPNLFDEIEGDEPLTESDTINTHRPKKLKKRKRNDYASEDENNFEVGDNGCFMFKMTPYVFSNSRLCVPIKFARSNGLTTQGPIRTCTQVYLMDHTRMTWPATLTKTKKQIYLTGWREFIAKNHLKVGDVCRFELVKHGEYLPVDFSISNGLKAGEMILRDNKGRSWKVHMNKANEKRLYLGYGLKDFLVSNGMKEGDAFKFELLEKKEDKPPIVSFMFLKSNPIKSHKQAKFTQKEGSSMCEEDGRPYFVGELKPGSIKQSILYLPKKFAKSNGLMNHNKMTLRNVEDERSWTVEFKNHKNTYYYIGRGWKDFRVANGLKEGDRFKFELVNKGENPITLNL